MSLRLETGSRAPVPAERLVELVDAPWLLHSLLEDHFPEMSGHWGWVALYARMTASRLGMGRDDVDAVERAAGLMDLGMLWMSDKVRLRRGEPGAAEREAIRRHPLKGEAALAEVRPGWEILPLVRHHHEWWDGNGYPDGIKGKAIPLGARVLCMADSFVAMLSPRFYRPPCSLDDALLEVMRSRGSQFDPEVADAFLQLMEERFGLPAQDPSEGLCPHRSRSVASERYSDGPDGLEGPEYPDLQDRIDLMELLWDINGVKRGNRVA
jgi:HD-GYP domain-containing protein (c-di-GMP phosphodiesterase class II)